VFFCAITTETVPNVTGHHFFDVFVPSYFLIANIHVATEEFFLLCILAAAYLVLVSVLHFGLGLNILVLFPSLQQWQKFDKSINIIIIIIAVVVIANTITTIHINKYECTIDQELAYAAASYTAASTCVQTSCRLLTRWQHFSV